jgi:hypothetical protein
MPCLFAVFALVAPRIVIVLLWLFTQWFTGVFPGMLLPILGFVFLPTTLLWVSAVHHWFGGQWTAGPIIGVVVAVLVDLSPATGKRERKT